jgi:ABC-type multidrug transport system ATPase subunit
MTQPSIVIEKLIKVYRKFTVLDNLDLRIEGATCAGFLGPNGAGKTTTLKVATRERRAFQRSPRSGRR